MFTVLVKYKDIEESSHDVRKDRLVEVVSRVSEIDTLEYIKIIPKENKPTLSNNFEL
ncbi:MAG TPA: hypothetical protein VK426_04835 [Methanobacterium sp.]|nr:hypothetical protein [Methanobacterium sp.]